jgi:hypothetical protein
VDLSIDAGDHKAMKRRWEKAKHKLRQTDQRYTDYLLEDVEGKRCMDNVGLRYVLPVVCGPYAEPAISFEPDFWLRYPSYDAVGPAKSRRRRCRAFLPLWSWSTSSSIQRSRS